MRVLTFSTLWPNPKQPLHGLFVHERTKALNPHCRVKVVAPVPWFLPVKCFGRQYYNYTQVPRREKHGALEVVHPRYLVLPKIMKWSDGWLMFASLFRMIRRLRREFPFDLIDAHWAYPDGYAAGCLARKTGVPYVVTVRGSDLTLFAKDPLRKSLIRRSLMGAEHVICVARSLQELVTGLGIERERTTVIENGIDREKFRPVPRDEARHRLQLPNETKIILSVGHLCELKGFHLLIEAARRLKTGGQTGDAPLKLVIVGEDAAWDPYQDVLARQIREHGLQDVVLLAGAKPPEELRFWYSSADLFCLASSREGCPNVVLESLACGTPVVGTSVGSMPEIVSSPDLGILVERKVESIGRGISEALARSWDRRYIADHARASYSWEKTALKIHAIFAQSLKSNSYAS